MFTHISALERLADTYHRGSGVVGARLEDYARDHHGIEIALFDSSIKVQLELGGRTYSAQAHVKVDDYTSPDRCGRIYFAVDTQNFMFVVDHVGLHDYA
jgi:hypothetical protein